ncbi:MAG: sterol desaturase family protein [Oscillatoria sp. PMC 1051.18]|nr:sterol desaturase family protein [Oscillatoria sp. PMC 1050.18]MEC5031850.1 sterol desaturase family protein [Oscillatoria sp. PMC 1051.18]
MKIRNRFLFFHKQFRVIILLVICAFLAVYFLQIWGFNSQETLLTFRQTYFGKLVWKTARTIVYKVFLNPYFYLPIAAIFALELIIPAKKNQKLFSVGIAQDFIWFLFDIGVRIILLTPYIVLVKIFYTKYLSFLTLDTIANLAAPIPLIFGLLIGDFLLWFSHFLKHKVKFFWYFHAIHHSQKELNLFTDLRFHFVEYLVAIPILHIPLYMLKVSMPTAVAYLFFYKWYLRTYHGNIKSNFGWFRYILVTPQSHRIHHSFQAKHLDKNFGNLFSIWDYLFNTQYKNYNEYPDTGIEDEHFPYEKSPHLFSLLKTYFAQLIYPFRLLIGK